MADANPRRYEDILTSPKESLSVELKQWFDPCTNEGKAKLAKACIALRNNNGGVLVVGVRTDGTFDDSNVPADIEKQFHPDIVQGIVTKYARELFEVSLSFLSFRTSKFVVIDVPSGVRSPVACKADLPGDGTLLRTDAIYVRTLSSNNTVSSSVARHRDWEQLIQYCFDNREADIGSFIRRHLAGVELKNVMNTLLSQAKAPAPKTPIQQAMELLDLGWKRFLGRAKDRNQSPPNQMGFRETAVVIDGVSLQFDLTQELLWKLDSSMPKQSGWPPWVILSRRAPEDMQPYVFENGWEAFVFGGAIGAHLDYWRIETAGHLYHVRALQDDMKVFQNDEFSTRLPEPYTTIDFMLQISRTSEAMSIAIAFAKALGCIPEQTSLAFAVRWRNLKGRSLSSWVDRNRSFLAHDHAVQNEISTVVTIPLDTPLTALSPYVERIVQPLFSLFGGEQLAKSVIEGIVLQTVERRL